MGVTFRTYVVAGVISTDAIKIYATNQTVTKYDEDTGEPYQKEVAGPPTVKLFGVPVVGADARYSPEDVLLASRPGSLRLPPGLEVFGTGGDADERVHVIGVKIARLDPCDEPFQLDDDTLAKGRGAALCALASVGYNHGVHAPIGIYVIHYAG